MTILQLNDFLVKVFAKLNIGEVKATLEGNLLELYVAGYLFSITPVGMEVNSIGGKMKVSGWSLMLYEDCELGDYRSVTELAHKIAAVVIECKLDNVMEIVGIEQEIELEA